MFKGNHDHSPPLRTFPLRKLKAVAKDVNVPVVGVKQVDGSVLSLSSVVSERVGDLEFKGQ